jgi:hypothetical protein
MPLRPGKTRTVRRNKVVRGNLLKELSSTGHIGTFVTGPVMTATPCDRAHPGWSTVWFCRLSFRVEGGSQDRLHIATGPHAVKPMQRRMRPAMPTLTTSTLLSYEEEICQVCHGKGEGCDGTVCHGFDAD